MVEKLVEFGRVGGTGGRERHGLQGYGERLAGLSPEDTHVCFGCSVR
jgi:hypothetical protein